MLKIQILAILAISVTTITPIHTQTNGCGKNCFKCIDGECIECYKSAITEAGVCELDTPLPHGCLVTGIDSQSGQLACSLCVKGMALEFTSRTCLPGSIDKCIYEYDNFGEKMCVVCEGFQPNDTKSACSVKMTDKLCLDGTDIQ